VTTISEYLQTSWQFVRRHHTVLKWCGTLILFELFWSSGKDTLWGSFQFAAAASLQGVFWAGCAYVAYGVIFAREELKEGEKIDLRGVILIASLSTVAMLYSTSHERKNFERAIVICERNREWERQGEKRPESVTQWCIDQLYWEQDS